MPKIKQATPDGQPRTVTYEDGRRVDLTWLYPPLERGVAIDWTGTQVAQFERSSGVGAPWRCTRAFALESDEVADLLALWLYDGALSWVAMMITSPECTDVPRYLVRVNNRGASRGARAQLRHTQWIEVEDGPDPAVGYVSLDAQGAERAGWAAITDHWHTQNT